MVSPYYYHSVIIAGLACCCSASMTSYGLKNRKKNCICTKHVQTFFLSFLKRGNYLHSIYLLGFLSSGAIFFSYVERMCLDYMRGCTMPFYKMDLSIQGFCCLGVGRILESISVNTEV
jgi:hypothetical protein